MNNRGITSLCIIFICVFAMQISYDLAYCQEGNNKGAIQKNKVEKTIDQLISINFRDMNIRDAFSSMAMEFKINIVLSSDIQGTVTVHLFKSTLDNALKSIARAGGYEHRQEGGTHLITTPQKDNKRAESQEDLEMKIFKLNFVEIEKIKEILNAIPDVRPIAIHEATKTIMVEDTKKNIKKIESIISSLDSIPKQVLIEAKILEVTLTDDMTYGIDWKAIMTDGNIQTNDFSNAVLPTSQGTDVVQPGAGSGLFANLIAGIGSSTQISMALEALMEKTTVNTVATPKILAIHGKKAMVQVGGQQGYKVSTSNLGVTSETIEFIDTGVILEITPHIDENNNILLHVLPTINSATIKLGIPVVNATKVATWLIAKSGETVFIGGLLKTNDTNTRESIPILGDIPVLGFLFGRTVKTKTKTELVVLITPRIIENHEPIKVDK